jgi:hypothetical protein
MENNLQLGDIIRIVSPKEPALNEQTFFVYYYDKNELLEIVHTSNMNIIQISLKDGVLVDSQIENIIILNRGIYKGFARQNGLIAGAWIELEFGGEHRIIVTGRVTLLVEDMIQITTFPEEEILYIDFAYKGIPRNIPLRKICTRHKPLSYKPEEEEDRKGEKMDGDDGISGIKETDEEIRSEYNDQGELELDIPAQLNLEKDYRDELHGEYAEEVARTAAASPDSFQYEVNLKPHQIKYDVDVQMNELLDDFLFKLPEDRRTRKAMREIYIHINRFKELREKCSLFDIHNQITGFERRDPQHYKPLVDGLYNMDTKIPWIYPVVTMSRELYGMPESLYTPHKDYTFVTHDFQISAEIETMRTMFLENDTPATHFSKYEQMYKQVSAQYYTPVSRIDDLVHLPIASKLQVLRDVDMVLAHDNTLLTTTVRTLNNDDQIFKQRKCVVSRFNEPIHYQHFVARNQSETRVLMESDSVDVQSLIVMPDSFLSQSVLLSPSSTILDKCNFNLPRVTSVFKSMQMQKKEIKLNITAPDNIFPLETAMTHVTLEPREDSLSNNQVDHPTYQAFLQAMVPSTFAIIDKYYPVNAHTYCLSDYLRTLSPYGLNHDTISFGASQRIRKHIIQNISGYNGEYMKKRDDFGNYAVEKFKVPEMTDTTIPSFTDSYFLDNRTILLEFLLSYKRATGDRDRDRKKDQPGIAGSELCHLVCGTNDFRLFSFLILLSNIALISPLMMLEPYIEPKHFYDATQKAIAKKYLTLRSMQDDNNNRALRYDTEYDANQYDALVKYKRERSKMTPDEFKEFLSMKLAEDYGCSMDNTGVLAEDLLKGFKLVREGDYALLEIKPQLPPGVEECSFTAKEKEEITIEANVRKIQKYFKRVDHTWIYDPDMDASSFAKSKDLTCALKENQGKIFTNQYGSHMKAIEEKVKEKIESEKKHLKLTWDLRKHSAGRFDKSQLKMGTKAYISEMLPSPNKKELDNINHRSIDFAAKQRFIIFFRQLRCRDPLPLHENPHFLYCIDSDSQPLLPLSQFQLAKAFEEGNYQKVLMEIIKTNGKVCDGYYVDRYCGNVLDQIDYSEQGMEMLVELDEQDTWEPETLDDSYKVDEHGQKRLYKNSKLRHVHNIMSAICKNLFITVENLETVTMALCMDFLSDTDIFIGEERYNKKMKDRKKKEEGAKVVPYETYYQSLLLDVCVCSLIISMQTKVPSLSPRRTFGDCVKNIEGFPLSEDSGNMGTLEYLACILRKMQEDKKTMPWKTILKKKGNMEQRLHFMFTNHILKNDRVSELLREKRNYMKENRDDDIPSYLQLDKTWPRFLPPNKPLHIINGKVPLRNITAAVHEELKANLKSGHPDQWKLLGLYFCKILSFSFGTLEVINSIVKDKGNLLGKYASVPIIENACCHELDRSYIPLEYFKQEDERMISYINSIDKLGISLDRTVQFIRPPFLHAEKHSAEVPDNTKRSIFCQYSEYLMYRTFIKYCNLDSAIKPIPSFLDGFLSEKPKEYNAQGSIEEKIAFLKEHGKNLNLTSFSSMMTQVNRFNTVKLQIPIDLSYQERVMHSLDAWKENIGNNDKLQSLYDHFKKYVDRENVGNDLDGPAKPVSPEDLKTELLNQFENSLQTHIDDMKKDIIHFMEDLDVRANVINKTMSMFNDWDPNLSYITFGHFSKNYLYYICSLVPNYIIEGNESKQNIGVLNLMREDAERLKNTLDEKYDNLSEFKKDPYLIPFMKRIKTSLKPMFDFLSNFYGFFPQDRQSLYGRYFQFCLLFIFHYMVRNTYDDDLLSDIFQRIRLDEANNENEEEEEEEEMKVADRGSVQTRLLKLMQTLLKGKNVFDRDRKTTIFTYQNIRKNVERLEGAEKKRMMDGFKNIKDIKTRRSELLLKKYHLGKFFVDPTVIKTYGKRRDKMLNTEDKTETDFLYGPNEVTEEDVEDLMDEFGQMNFEETLEIPQKADDGFYNVLDEYDEDDEYDDEAHFTTAGEDDDANDMAENLGGR